MPAAANRGSSWGYREMILPRPQERFRGFGGWGDNRVSFSEKVWLPRVSQVREVWFFWILLFRKKLSYLSHSGPSTWAPTTWAYLLIPREVFPGNLTSPWVFSCWVFSLLLNGCSLVPSRQNNNVQTHSPAATMGLSCLPRPVYEACVTIVL